MEDLAPPLKCSIFLRNAIESGQSVRMGLIQYIQSGQQDFNQQLAHFLSCRDQKFPRNFTQKEMPSPYRRALVELIDRGLAGESILAVLTELEIEIKRACEDEVELFLKKMPFLMLIPLLFLMFPALLILVLGPFLFQLLTSL